MRNSVKVLSVSLITAVLMSGCMGGPTPEEKRQQEITKEMIMESMNRYMNQNTPASEPKVQQAVAPLVTISEAELKKQFNNFDTISSGVKFTKYDDGFSINDSSRYMDPEGKIVSYGYDWKTGDVTYMIESEQNSFKIKFMRALTEQSPIDIANVKRSGKLLKVRTVTGKKFTSTGLILTSQGFITLRNDTAFEYKIGKKTKSFAAPKGWHIAKFQNGDVASTNYLLLEKNVEVNDNDGGISGLISSSKSVMNSFGIMDKNDYMLINIDNTKKRHLLDIDMSDKDVGTYSQCEKMNSYVRKCDNVSFRESLYDNNGLPNVGHYYWRIMWYSTKDGRVISVTKEATHKKVIIADLATGKKVEAAYRLTGFPELTTSQDATGKIKIIAGGGMFSDVTVEDAEQFLDAKDNKLVDN
ncbi:MAG: hypothetical protein DRG78_04165 [Epsilonproteobacteria bacterium]|nr:MAG: hypothetical protein DRG78_04165 [Campylobacterota bacterium]